MKTIVYATDFSQNSVPALKFAYDMSKKIKARLVAIHIYDIPTNLGEEMMDPFLFLNTDYYEINQTKLDEFLKINLGDKVDMKNVQAEAIENIIIIEGIISKIKELDAFMVVTGMTGKGAIRDLLMGSVTKKLIEKAPCPVFAIPENISQTQIKTIVYASDFEEEDVDVIHTLATIAKPFKAEIKVVHVATKDLPAADERMEWFKDMLKEKVTYEKLDFEVLLDNDVYNALRIYIGNVSADITAMLERKKGGFLKNVFQRDLVKKMKSYGKIPLLSFNEANYASKKIEG